MAALHEFFEDGAVWSAHGIAVDAAGNRVVLNAEAHVRHAGELWHNDSWGEAEGAGERLEHRYTFPAIAAGQTLVQWTSQMSGVGPCRGVFVLVGDTILSQGRADNGSAWWVESVQRTGTGRYLAHGGFFRDGVGMSTSILDLTRME